MKSFIDAVKNNDLVDAKKLFSEMMKPATTKLVEEEKLTIVKSIVIEGEEKSEEPDEDPEDEEKDDKKDKKDDKKDKNKKED
jgi:hypothetical protein